MNPEYLGQILPILLCKKTTKSGGGVSKIADDIVYGRPFSVLDLNQNGGFGCTLLSYQLKSVPVLAKKYEPNFLLK